MTETFERSGLVTSQPEKLKQNREHDSRNRRSESENSSSKKMSGRSDGLP